MEDKKTQAAMSEKQAAKKRPSELSGSELDSVQGGAVLIGVGVALIGAGGSAGTAKTKQERDGATAIAEKNLDE